MTTTSVVSFISDHAIWVLVTVVLPVMVLKVTKDSDREFIQKYRPILMRGMILYAIAALSVLTGYWPLLVLVGIGYAVIRKMNPDYFACRRVKKRWPIVVEQIHLIPEQMKVKSVKKTVLGYELKLRLTAPTTMREIENNALAIATAYRVARVRVVHQVSETADMCSALLDETIASVTTELTTQNEFDLDPMRAFELGLDINARPVMFSLCYKSMLVGGIPGAGKSNFIKLILSYLVTSKNVELFAIDPKKTELVQFKDAFASFVSGSDAKEIRELLQHILDVIALRATYLATTGKTKMVPTKEFPLIVLVIDELAELATFADKKEREEIQMQLRRIVSLGRAFCVTTIVATQKPSSINIDTNLRSLIPIRAALACADRSTAEMILGLGTFNDSDLTSPYVGKVLFSDGGPCNTFQSYEITDDFIADLLKRYTFAHPKTSVRPPVFRELGGELFMPRLKPLNEVRGTTQEGDDVRKKVHKEIDGYGFR